MEQEINQIGPTPKNNSLPFVTVVTVILTAIIVGGGIYWWVKQKESNKIFPNQLSYQVGNSSVRVDFSLGELALDLGPAWRVFSIADLPTDVTKKESSKLFYGQGCLAWCLDDQFGVQAHYALVSPERWNEITKTSSDKLNQFGYLGEPPTVLELLREIDAVVLPKQHGQSLEQFMKSMDDKLLTIAKNQFDAGNASREYLQWAQSGFFGNFKNKEVVTISSQKVQALLLSNRTTPPAPDTELFLLLGCTQGDRVFVLSKGPFSSGKMDYPELLRSLGEKFSFNENFCN